MKILKLHYPTGHPYWDANEYRVQKPDGSFVDINALLKYKNSYEVWIEKNGDIMLAECNCSSGGGKVRFYDPTKAWHKSYEWAKPRVIVSANEYDKIEYIGEPLVISEELQQEINENRQ